MFEVRAPLRGYDDLFSRLLAGTAPGRFYDDFTKPIVPWRADLTNLVLHSDRTDIPVRISVTRIGDYHPNVLPPDVVSEIQVVPQNPQTSFGITLGQGLNRIIAEELVTSGRTSYFEIIATTNTLLLEPMARELYVSESEYDEQMQALYSRFSTRMLDQVVSYQDLITEVQSLKIMAYRLLVRERVHFPAREIGIRNLIESFTLNTPYMRDQRYTEELEIERNRSLRGIEISAGQEAHVWFPNLAVTRWLAFTRMVDTLRDNYDFISVRDDLVRVSYKGETQQHKFDFNDPGSKFLTSLSYSNCFDNFDMNFTISFLLNYTWCVWAYPFDEFVTELTPIGQARTSFDLGVPFDSGLEFDADPIDPYTDGFVGWSLTGRFDSEAPQLALDTHVVPSSQYAGPQCVYTGPYTQMLNTHNFEIPIDAEVTIQSATWADGYGQAPIDSVGMTLPSIPQMIAGQQYLAAVKFTDLNGMTNSTGSGIIRITESAAGDVEDVPVASGGFQWFYLTPTRAGQTYWDVASGPWTGRSDTISVVAGPFARFEVSVIPPLQVGQPYTLNLQTTDAYGNPQANYGVNDIVQIDEIGFAFGSFSPTSVRLDHTGFATVQITFSQPGTGALRIKLNPVQTDTNIFIVSP